ncbi:MAG: hypothetical protein LBD21_03530 [Tannerellaceae bacterium]|jgi:predicted nucleotide-binding protein (sugar kinase/HSP70/actin superfamily)|nr:hypothetical protein [Tannerellaceae bacterium]
MESTKLNPTQLHLLRIFAYHKDEESLNELKAVWLEHVRKKLDAEGRRLWEEKNMSNEMLEEILNTHIRTPYK